VVADGKTLQIPQALTATQDSQQCHQKELPGRNAHASAHPGIRYRLEVADQVEIGCSRVAFEHREEAIPPTSTHADSTGKEAYDRL
jgi:hypothetical protein